MKFADDIDLLEESNNARQDAMDTLFSENEQFEIHANVEKTIKTMVFGRKAGDNDASISINAAVPENVDISSDIRTVLKMPIS